MVPASISRMSPPSASGVTATSPMPMPRSFIFPASAPMIQLLEALAFPDAAAVASKYAASSRDDVSTPASYGGRPYCSTKRRRRASGSSGRSAMTSATQLLLEGERWQIGLGEVAVVVRLFLPPHRPGAAGVGVPQAGFLIDRAAGGDDLGLPGDLVLDGALHVPEGVEVLDFDLDAERGRPGRPHRDVGVAAQAALFHVAVVDADGHEDGAQAREELRGIGRRPQVRLGDDLDERHAAAVEVEMGPAIGVREAVVQRLAGVLLHVHAGDADLLAARTASGTRPRRRARAAGRTGRSDSPWAGRGRSSSCARRWRPAARRSRGRAPRARRTRPHGGSARAGRRAGPGRPGTPACWAPRRTTCCSRRRSCWRSAAGNGSRGR